MLNLPRFGTWLVLAACLLAGGCSKAAKLERYIVRADKAFAAGNYDAARIEYLNAFQIDRSNARAITQLAIIYHDMGSLRLAAPFLGRALELEPTNVDLRFRLAMFLATGDRDRALAEVTRILEQQPTHPEAPLLLTDLARTAEDIGSTREQLASLRAKNGETATLFTAEAILRLRERQVQDAEALVQKALALDPKFAPGHLTLAIVEITRTNLDAADRSFQTAVELSPTRSDRQIRYLQFKRDRNLLDDARRLGEALTVKAPDYLPAWLFLAQLDFDQRQFDDADKHLERITSRDPAHYEANVLHARIRLARNEPARAVEELERLATVYPNSPDLKHQLALASLLNRDIPKAHANASQAVQLNPEATDAVMLLATLNIARGDFDSAISGLTGILSKQPGNSRAALALAQAYRGKGRLDDALGIYQNYRRAVPKDPQGPFNCGAVLRQLNRQDEARTSFEQVLELDPTSVAAMRQLVEIDLQAGRIDVALTRTQAFAESQPDAAAAQLLLAQVYMARKNDGAAETALKKTLAVEPNAREAQILLARLYVASNREQQALDELNAVVQRNTNDIGALLLIGTIHSEARAYDQAIATYEKAVLVDSNYVPALNNLAYLLADQPGGADRAYELARRARGLQPNDPAIADTLGWVHFQRAEYVESLPLFFEAAAKRPSEPEIQYHIGVTHYMLGQEQAARVALEAALKSTTEFNGRSDAEQRLKILELDVTRPSPQLVASLESSLKDNPRDVVALLRLGALHESAGDVDSALQAYNRALAISPQALAPQLRLAQLYATRPNDREQALTLAKRARDIAPNDPAVAQTLGHLVYQAGDHAWALSLLSEAAQRIQDNPALLYDLAWAQYSVGRVTNAAATMQAALKLSPTFAQAEDAHTFSELLSLSANPSAPGSVGAQVRQALQKNPNYAPALMLHAMIQAQQPDIHGARRAVENVLGQFPLFSPAQRMLTSLYLAAPVDYQKAFEHGLKAREAYPGDIDVARDLGVASYYRGDYRRAVELLTEAIRQRSDDPGMLLALGLAQHRLNRSDDARPNLEKAITLAPNAPLAAEARKVLGEMGDGR